MTVPATARRAGPFLGTGVITPLPFTFKVFEAADVVVTRAADGVETVLVLGDDYTVSLNPDQDASPGGTVTPLVAPAAGETTTLTSGLEYEQTLDLLGGGSFRPKNIEDAFDRTVIQIQQLAEEVDRSLRFPVSFDGDATLPGAADRANKLLGFDTNGAPLMVTGGSGGGGSGDVLATQLADGDDADHGAGLVAYGGTLDYAAGTVGAELRTAQAQTEHFWRAVRNNQRDVYVIVTGDSTGNEATEWVYLMAQWLATECPTHTIKYRLFNDGTTSWDSYTTLQTGTGPALPFSGTPFTIHIDNGSVSGTNTFYTQGGRESAFWSGNDYDLAIVNYGHNLGTGQTEAIAVPEWVMALSHVRLMAPRAGMLVTLQNPRQSSTSDINTNGSAATARMVAAWRKAVELVGAGVIDVYSAFANHPDYPSLMADETHPSPAGSALWLSEVKRVMAEPVRYTGDAPLGYNPLAESRPNYAPNPRFATWTAATPDGWTFTNCTPTKDTGRTDGSLYSMKVTIGAGTNPRIRADLSNYIKHLAGKTCTFVARIWRPTGLDLLTGRIAIASTNNVSSSGSFISYPRGTPSSGGWEYVIATYTIPRNHTQLTLDIYAGAADGSDSGEFFHVDSVWFGTGWLPGVASLETVTEKFVPDYYNDGNVGLIPANTTGTVTAVGGVITLTGSTSPNAGAYIDLPGLTAGVTYTVSFNPVSCTGNTAGGVYVRNGFGGGFTDITKASGTGDWTVGGGTVTFTFVAPNGPVSIWPYGYTGATGWVLDQWSITPPAAAVSSVPQNLRVTEARNSDGTHPVVAPTSSNFGVSVTAGTAHRLLGQILTSATATNTAIWDLMLPATYVAGTNLSVVVNVNHNGTGTPGTRTIDVEAYRTANDGSQGADICATAAQNMTGTAADYTFTVTGTSLSPGDRLLLRVRTALQETGGVNSLQARLNSVRVA